MQNLDNNLDDLFRKASENYLLKATEKKWDDVSLFLNIDPSITIPAGKNRNNMLMLLLFAFLLIALSLLFFVISHQLTHSG